MTPRSRLLGSGVAAYALWGSLPLFWYLLRDVSAMAVLANRVVWSSAFLFLLILASPGLKEFGRVLSLSQVGLYSISSVLLAMNWGFYVWAVTHGYVLAASLGYFIAPIFYVGAGVLILREPLTRSRGWATGIAGVALLPLVIGSGYATVLIAVVLAVSIVAYSLLRKRGALMAIPALFVESVVLTPLALLYLWISHGSGVVCSECSDRQAALLVTSGIVTLVPLVFFGVAVRGLPLSTIGFLQYISPCLQLALGLWFFGEQMDMGRAVTFGLVWIAIIVNLLGDRGQAPPGNRQPQKIE